MNLKFKGDQEMVYNAFIDFYKSERQIMLLKGRAGTGKTYIAQQLIEYIVEEKEVRVAMLAPTGQAVRVCKQNATVMNNLIDYRTIHSAFRMRPKKINGKLVFFPDYNAESPINKIDIIFVDEVSMLEDRLFDEIIAYVEQGKKFVLIGDEGQIPPINHSYSKPFKQDVIDLHNIQVVELKKPIRQAEGNPILDLASVVYDRRNKLTPIVNREDVENGARERVWFVDKSYNKKSELYGLVEQFFSNKKAKDDSNFVKLLAWTRATVSKWNSIIRPIVFGRDNLGQYEIGERLLADAPLEREKRIIFPTNELLYVKNLEIDTAVIHGTNYKYYMMTVMFLSETGAEKEEVINVLHKDSQADFDKQLDYLSKEAKRCKAENNAVDAAKYWSKFWQLMEAFQPVLYDYAKTCHKSQGSTYKHCFVIEDDIQKNKKVEERNRILYVAMTRPKKSLFIVS